MLLPSLAAIALIFGGVAYLLHNRGGTPSATQQRAAYVGELYSDLSARSPTAAELAAVPKSVSDPAARSAIVRAILKSPAVSAHLVDITFTELLQRPPSKDERSLWSGRLTGGASRETLVRTLVTSSEYISTRGRGDPMKLIRSLLRDLTGNEEDAALGGRLLSAGQSSSPDQLALMTFESDEHRAHLVNIDYRLALRRPPDPAGAAAFRAQIKGGHPNEDVLLFLLSSDEYLQLSAARGQ